MKVEENKIVIFIQEIKSEGELLAKWKRKVFFTPGCFSQLAYDSMLNLNIGKTVSFIDCSLIPHKYDSKLRQSIPIQKIKNTNGKIIKGMAIFSKVDGQKYQGLIKEVNDDHVIIDANHPWIGKELSVSITIIDIINPTAADLNDKSIHAIESLI